MKTHDLPSSCLTVFLFKNGTTNKFVFQHKNNRKEKRSPFVLASQEEQPAPSFVAVPNGIVHS